MIIVPESSFLLFYILPVRLAPKSCHAKLGVALDMEPNMGVSTSRGQTPRDVSASISLSLSDGTNCSVHSCRAPCRYHSVSCLALKSSEKGMCLA